MLKNQLLGTAAMALSVTAMAGSASAAVIDSFDDADMAISIGGPLAEADPDVSVTLLDNDGAAAAASIIGGYRDITTTLVASPAASRTTDAEVLSGLGTFSHSQETGVRSNSYITWDGLAGAGLGSADLSSDNNFHLVVLSADDGVVWSLQLFDSDSDFTHTFANVGDILSATDMYLPFSIWSLNGIDFSDISKIVFGANIESVVDFDTEVDLIETVSIPEPASLTLLGAGLMGLGYFGKRRKA